MPLADLLEVLRRDSDARATVLVAAAREEADRMVADAEARLARRMAEALKVREGALRTAAAAEVEAARGAAMRDVLLARAEALAKVFARARTLLAQRAGDPALEPGWTQAIAEARSYLPAGEAVVQRPPEVAGITVAAADGSIGIDGTTEGLLSRLESSLAVEIARELESGS